MFFVKNRLYIQKNSGNALKMQHKSITCSYLKAIDICIPRTTLVCARHSQKSDKSGVYFYNMCNIHRAMMPLKTDAYLTCLQRSMPGGLEWILSFIRLV